MKNQLLEEITREYSLQILKWAYKKCGDGDRAEELTQEVMLQIFSAIQKNDEAGKNIEQVEHFVWKIARYVWCHSLRDSTRYMMCPMDENLKDETDFAGELAEREEQKQLLMQLRKQVSRLNYLQREILVSFYIDGLPQKTIAERLGISESAVKWHLHDTRRKLKKEMDKFTPESERMNQLLVDIIKAEFDISHIDEDRKYDLAKLVEWGYVKLRGDKAIPQFAVMTGKQYEQLGKEVFEPIVQKLQPGYELLKKELTKLYQTKLPKHLEEVGKLPLVQSLYAMAYVTTLLAFRENRLYIPKDSEEGEFLTMMYVNWEE